MYKLKKGAEEFQVVEGPFARKHYKRNEIYAEVPPQEKHRFEEIKPAPVKAVPTESKTSAGKESKKKYF